MHMRADVDVGALESELRRNLRGEVRFSDGDRALYSTDSSNYRQIPIGVVIPRDRSDVIATVASCRRYGAPITGRGGGTSLAGQCCNVAVIIDFTKYYNRILELDVEQKLVRVQPGIVLDEMNHAVKKHGLIFGPDPATHNHCAIGGMLGNNSCGVHSVMAEFHGGGARSSDNVRELEVLLYDGTILRVGKTSPLELEQIIQGGGRRGEIYHQLRGLRDQYGELVRQRYPKIPRRVSGYNLDDLLPENGFNVARALVGTEGTCALVLEATLELIVNPPVRSLLVLGYPDIYHAGDHVPEIRKYKPVGLEGIDAVLIDAMKVKHIHPRDFRALLNKHGYLCTLYGHFGQGLVHTRIDFGLKTHEGIQTYLRFTDDAAELIKRYGGSLSGEHGDGQSRGELLPKMFGEELVRAFAEFKQIWDPDWIMN